MRAKKEPVCGSLYADTRVEKAVHRSLSSWAPFRPLYMACGHMESLCRNGLRPHGCGKPVAAMACGRWLWKACGCNGLWPLVVESLWLL